MNQPRCEQPLLLAEPSSALFNGNKRDEETAAVAGELTAHTLLLLCAIFMQCTGHDTRGTQTEKKNDIVTIQCWPKKLS